MYSSSQQGDRAAGTEVAGAVASPSGRKRGAMNDHAQPSFSLFILGSGPRVTDGATLIYGEPSFLNKKPSGNSLTDTPKDVPLFPA